MLDRRFDRQGELLARDEVLRLRIYRHPDGRQENVLAWKGPVSVSPQGYKARQELELELQGPGAKPEELLGALGYLAIQTIERYVEYFHLDEAVVRLEWYPRMDVLVEVEGDEAGIEAALRVIGLPRETFSSEPLPAFVSRYGARTGRPAALVTAELEGAAPAWERR
jgi:adenylate cyclase class IV